MTGNTRVTLAILGVVAILAAAYFISPGDPRSRKRDIRGVVTSIDAANRKASMRYIHPKSGQEMELPGVVPAGCEILINDQPAQLSDLVAGDEALVHGGQEKVDGKDVFVASKVRVTRQAAAASPAATQPAQP